MPRSELGVKAKRGQDPGIPAALVVPGIKPMHRIGYEDCHNYIRWHDHVATEERKTTKA